MKLLYIPEDGERQDWPIRIGEMMSMEAEAIEEAGGTAWDSFDQFADKLARGNFKAKRALLWMFLRRTNPRLRFVDLVVRYNELAFISEDDDRQAARDMLESGTHPDGSPLTDEDRAELADIIGDPEPAIVVDAPGKGEPDDTPTDSPSPPQVSEPSPNNEAGT